LVDLTNDDANQLNLFTGRDLERLTFKWRDGNKLSKLFYFKPGKWYKTNCFVYPVNKQSKLFWHKVNSLNFVCEFASQTKFSFGQYLKTYDKAQIEMYHWTHPHTIRYSPDIFTRILNS